jgi:hypothetical protein
MDNYEQLMPKNHFLKNHCEYKLEIYRKMFNDLIRKHEKHVSFNGSNNFNNNNSTRMNSSTTSSNSSTPQQFYTHENFRKKKSEIRDQQRKFRFFSLIDARRDQTIRGIYVTYKPQGETNQFSF